MILKVFVWRGVFLNCNILLVICALRGQRVLKGLLVNMLQKFTSESAKKITGIYANDNLHVNMQKKNDMQKNLNICTVFSKVSSAGSRTLSNNTSGHFRTTLLGTFDQRFRALSNDTQIVLKNAFCPVWKQFSGLF